MNSTHKKVVVIGLDGSSWDLVEPLVREGRLPHIKAMMEAGTHSMMRSTNPAHSAPAWTTFATGVPPTQHGCLDFLVINKNIDDLKLIDSTQIPQETIYEAMVRNGRKPILINLPNTFPPRLTDSITITSLMTRGDKFIYPESLKEKYPSLQNYRLSPNPTLRMKDNFDAYVRDLCLLEEQRIAGAKDLFTGEDWDFFFYLSSGTDWVSHVVYDKAIRDRYQPAIRMWEIMDEFIGWVREHADEQTNVFVMSDHGFTVYDDIFYVNRWLENQGYLATKQGKGTFHQDHTQLSKAISKAQKQRRQLNVGKGVRALLSSSPTIERFAKWVYTKVVKRFVPITVNVDLQLDIEKTKVAFPRGSMATMLYINDVGRFSKGTVTVDEKESLVRKLTKELSELQDKNHNSVITNVHTKTELYGPDGLQNAPDVFLQPGNYYLSGSLHSSSLFEHTTKNYHDERGMFIAAGPDIAAEPMADTDIHNMAPTVLHAMNVPVLRQCVGDVMQIFKTESSLHRPVQIEQDNSLDDINI